MVFKFKVGVVKCSIHSCNLIHVHDITFVYETITIDTRVSKGRDYIKQTDIHTF